MRIALLTHAKNAAILWGMLLLLVLLESLSWAGDGKTLTLKMGFTGYSQTPGEERLWKGPTPIKTEAWPNTSGEITLDLDKEYKGYPKPANDPNADALLMRWVRTKEIDVLSQAFHCANSVRKVGACEGDTALDLVNAYLAYHKEVGESDLRHRLPRPFAPGEVRGDGKKTTRVTFAAGALLARLGLEGFVCELPSGFFSKWKCSIKKPVSLPTDGATAAEGE